MAYDAIFSRDQRIVSDYAAGLTLREIAERHNTSKSNAWRIIVRDAPHLTYKKLRKTNNRSQAVLEAIDHLTVEQPTVSARDLSDYCKISKPSVVRTLQNLDAQGLIQRTRIVGGSRVVNIALSPKGARRLDEIEAS